MNSILHNSAAMSALQSLNMTQQALSTVQNQVSSGLAVANASDNAAYWSIATQLNANSTMVTASNSALTQSQAVLDTANTAIKSIITTINSIQTALTEATNPGAALNNINTTLAALGQQLTDAVTGASFNGINVVDGSSIAGSSTSISFVSGYNAATANVTAVGMSMTSIYTADPTAGNAGTGILGVAVGTTTLAGTYDLTQLGASTAGGTAVTASNAQDILTAVNAALNSVTNYAASIGATQDRMSSMSNLNMALTNNYAKGVSGLVDADMNTASTRLQALQTQQQLGIQSLSIANQNAQLIMKLFG
ncbi:MAG: flagellin [Pseudomonadota bacterium]|nr:flagellin [Pseudomonadota bacterium]